VFNFKQVPEFRDLVTFIPNKHEPIHDWYYYKEGYAKQLVDILIDRFKISSQHIVLDPFTGVGTTLLACKQRGIQSIGFDVSPLCTFVSRVKTSDYEISELSEAVIAALKWKFRKPLQIPQDKWLKRVFSSYALEDIVFYRNNIMQLENEKLRNFLMLGLLDSAMHCSYAYKDGAFVKIMKRPVAPVGKIFKYKIRRMLKELRENQPPAVEARIESGDARDLKLEDGSVDFVITSPPYLNKIEYTQIYRTEYALFFDLPETRLRSFIGESLEETLQGFESFPPAAQAYFKDMKKVSQELYRVCKPGAKLAVVIGGGCFPDQSINVDELFAKLSENIGFKINDILVARNSWCTRAKTIKIGQIRESIVIMER